MHCVYVYVSQRAPPHIAKLFGSLLNHQTLCAQCLLTHCRPFVVTKSKARTLTCPKLLFTGATDYFTTASCEKVARNLNRLQVIAHSSQINRRSDAIKTLVKTMSVFVCARKSVLVLLTISLVLTIIRQIFDFIGRLWLPIAVNFSHMLFLIFGYFGILQYRPGFLITSAFWLPLCLTWNVFLCCYYLSLKPLDRNQPLLSFGMRFSR